MTRYAIAPTLFVTLFTLTLPSQAQTRATTSCSVYGPPGSQCRGTDQQVSDVSSLVSAHAQGGLTANSRATSDAWAATGALGASATVVTESFQFLNNDGTSYRVGGSASATSEAVFQSVLIIDKPGLAGQAGTIDVPLLLTGSAASKLGKPTSDTRASGEVTWSAGYQTSRADGSLIGYQTVAGDSKSNLDGTQAYWTQVHAVGDMRKTDPFTFSDAIPSVVLTLNIYFGQPIQLQGFMSVKARAGTSEDDLLMVASAGGDFLHTARWGGITAVHDAHGQAVSGWSVASPSGVDFSLPVSSVPEPSSWMLLLVGAAGLGLGRRAGVKGSR